MRLSDPKIDALLDHLAEVAAKVTRLEEENAWLTNQLQACWDENGEPANA
jgi:outer membrane murein-binding lipoprotein Lpp